jgi:hypothetical protein
MSGERWVRIDCDYLSNPKVLAAGRDARDLHLASILYVGQHELDGLIPAQAVPQLVRALGVRPHVIEALTAAGLWVPNGGATFELPGYLERNPSKETRERERVRWRENKRRQRERND